MNEKKRNYSKTFRNVLVPEGFAVAFAQGWPGGENKINSYAVVKRTEKQK